MRLEEPQFGLHFLSSLKEQSDVPLLPCLVLVMDFVLLGLALVL